MPRAEAACALCARLDWKEHRYELNLFAQPPASLTASRRFKEDSSSSSSEEEQRVVLNKGGKQTKVDAVAYVDRPEKLQEFLSVERYAERWPLIPIEGLHASSVQHPDNPSWRWLLHSRRVPVLSPSCSSTDDTDSRPSCAGTGDPTKTVWVCKECKRDVTGTKPLLPLFALANDNWIGRERMCLPPFRIR